MSAETKILVTGATGYVGGRLVERLLQQKYTVRVMARNTNQLLGRPWIDSVDVVQGNVLEPDTLINVMNSVDVAYYLIHSMGNPGDFVSRDIEAANNFAAAAFDSGVKQIIYLGGLGESSTELSEHLHSRQQTGLELKKYGTPVTEFRAGVIVGSGSLSFEIIRYLTERVPIMISPRWVYTKTQPISIRNVLDYLVSAILVKESLNQVFEIGGENIMTYADMLLGYAKVRGLNRLMVPIPFLTPFLSSYWVHWVTPIPATIARPLVEGLKNEVIVTNSKALDVFPSIKLIDYETAVRTAIQKLESGEVVSRWTDSLMSSQGDKQPVTMTTTEGMIIENRTEYTDASVESLFKVFSQLGGEKGWLFLNWAWWLRGVIDRLVGGVGFRRGRRDSIELRPGDALDFWRVEEVQDNKLIRLRAEMKVPGLAWLQFEAYKESNNGKRSVVEQTAFFAPRGLFGHVYWYLLYPIHAMIFSGMIKKIVLESEALDAS